ncbi:MAG: class I SAM-dependent DNA methyltransferase [Methanospirillum sp.]
MTIEVMTQAALEHYLWEAAVLLRGTIDPVEYKQYIFPLLFFKRICDVYDEEYAEAIAEYGDEASASFPENHRFQVPKGAHWRDVRETTKEVGKVIQAAMRAIEKANAAILTGIFGDAAWTNTERLPDATLRDLIEHFSSEMLSLARVPADEFGQGYEYLIKKFADDSGHTAAEFYTNRTLVRLMTRMLAPQAGESIYDPTCGTGGMLLVAALQLKEEGKEHRGLKLFGQDINLLTSVIARMNLFLHGIDDFTIVRGDTLAAPAFLENDRLKTFDVILANPPYSIKRWNRTAFTNDPYGRNRFGVPPQSWGDYAFFQHILASLDPTTGRCAILFPHGVLFREAEKEMRRRILEADLIECVLGLGPNLFYNSPMEACVVVCRARKPAERKGKVLLINAVNEVTRDRSQSTLLPEHVDRILDAYRAFGDEEGFARVVKVEDVLAHDANLSISLYITPGNGDDIPEKESSLTERIAAWEETSSMRKIAAGDLLTALCEANLYD